MADDLGASAGSMRPLPNPYPTTSPKLSAEIHGAGAHQVDKSQVGRSTAVPPDRAEHHRTLPSPRTTDNIYPGTTLTGR